LLEQKGLKLMPERDDRWSWNDIVRQCIPEDLSRRITGVKHDTQKHEFR